jgi:protein-S-isoprenylcysteine O-methyltransferase Ste14
MHRLLRLLSYVPPPLLFVVPLLLGLRMNDAHPQPIVPPGVARLASGLGLVLVAIGALLVLSAIALFIRRRTTIVPHRRSRALVTTGPFRLTRNPMYVALSSVFVGICFLANTPWPLLLLALPLTHLHAVTIPREERLLREAFGPEYETYAARVRRWL